MAVRQYIGARYVTKIYENSLDPSSAEWEASVNYEPLTMVTFNNGSYLSKKDVPASVGNPANNPTYWVQTGFYNGQIASLQAQIDAINATIASLNSRKIVFIGDSYMENLGDESNSFARLASNKLGLVENTDYWISAIGGQGFARPGHQFITQLQNITVSVDDDKITDVIVCGGANDISDISNIESSIETFAAACHTRFPNAALHLGFTDWFMGSGYNYIRMINEWRKGAYATGSKFIDNIWLSQHSWHVKNNDGHPNADGQIDLATCLTNYLLTGAISDPEYSFIPVTLVADQACTISGGTAHNSFLNGKMCSISLDTAVFSLNTPVTMGPGTESGVSVASLATGTFAGSTYQNRPYEAMCLLYDENSATHLTQCQVFFHNGIIKIVPRVSASIEIHHITLYANTYVDSFEVT